MRDERLQALCRHYLSRLEYIARKHGLGTWVKEIKRANKRKECEGTRHEVEMLSRLCDDERLSRTDVPKFLGKSYRQCSDNGDFDRIKKLKHVGIYSKVSTILYANRKSNNKKD